MTPERAQTIIESLDSNTDLKQNTQACKAIEWAVQSLDQGSLRIASYSSTSKHWVHHAWLQKAVSLYFKIKPIQLCQHPWPHRDVVPGKYATTHQVEQAIHQRMVPPSYVRYGSYIGKHVVLMPCFVNIGAYVGDHSMLDAWSTVGSCAQIGQRVHLSGGAGIGGVLEPATATPTIIEDDCFIGARSEIVEGVLIQSGAVIAPGVYISQSTKIYDRTNGKIIKGMVPQNAVVVPGSIPAKDGTHSVYAPIIVKYADDQTRGKVALSEYLREATSTI